MRVAVQLNKSEEAQLRYHPISSTETQRAARRGGLAARVHRDSGLGSGATTAQCTVH